MQPALTTKSQVTLPKAVRTHLAVGPGDRVKFSALSGGRVVIERASARKPTSDPFETLVGRATVKLKTNDVMRATRGADWNRA